LIGLLESQPLLALGFAITLGTLIGTFTGLVPGVHVNTVAPIVLAVALATTTQANDPTTGALWAALLIFSVAIVHTLINVIPTLAAPLPEDDTALILLPVQRMTQAGHAREALTISIIASWTAAALATLLLVTILLAFPRHVPNLPHGITLYAVTGILVLLLSRQSRPMHATMILLFSGTAGLFLLDRSFPGPLGGDGTVLLPAFAGLFGAPLLLLTLTENSKTQNTSDPSPTPTTPSPTDSTPPPSKPTTGRVPALLGTFCGLLVALFPGLTSATAGAFGRALRQPRSDAEDVAMISAVDTANVIGNTGALLVWGATRSGASAAAQSAHPTIAATGAGLSAALGLAGLLGATALAGLAALRWGPRLVEVVRRIPPRSLAAGALALLALIVLLAAGPTGLLVTLLLVPLGLLPHKWGAPRALLMGFLLVPYLGASFAAGPVL
jgi:putative membrane protein